MPSPLVLKNYGSRTMHVGTLLCALLTACVLLCASSAWGQELRTTASHNLYPRTLDLQLRQIIESPAAEVEPLREICAALLRDINDVVLHIERTPTEPYPYWERFEEALYALETLWKSWTVTDSVAEPYIPSAVALDEIVLALHRRAFIWHALLHAEAAEATPLTTLFGKSYDDIDRLMERTFAVRRYFIQFGSRLPVNRQTRQTWCDFLETQSWLNTLEASRQPVGHTVRLVSFSSSEIPVETLRTLSDRANTTIQRLDTPTFTNEQRSFLNHPVVNMWREELLSWSSDTIAPIHILPLIEQYEETGGMSDMRALARFVDQLSVSRTPEYRQLGENIRLQYGMANVRVFISNSLLNNHVPPTTSETARFRDTILSQPVIGRRQTETEITVSFIPHPTRVLVSVDVDIALETMSRTDAFATQLFNTGRTNVAARKQIELTERGFLTEPSQAQILDHRMRLVGMDTDFDGVPIISRLFRGIVRNQYDDRFREASTETQRTILRQVRGQLNRETEERLRPINERIRMLSQYVEDEFDLRVEQRASRTEENWLLTTWGICSPGTLLASTPPPATLPGAFADLKIHESLPNLLLSKLELEGKRGAVRDFKGMLAEKFQQPDLAASGENDNVELMFASYNPVVVRFVDGRVELTISIAALRLLGRTHRDFQVIVRYSPDYDSEGRLVLRRDGYISLINVREQVIIRAAFAKIFPVNRPFSLVPNMLESDPQFDYLTTGQSRIANGWFAVALVERE